MKPRFVILGYARDITEARGVDLALVTLAAADQESVVSPPINLQLVPQWRSIVKTEDLPYLEAILAEIMEQGTADVFDAISDMSAGCLRAVETGILGVDTLPDTFKDLSTSRE